MGQITSQFTTPGDFWRGMVEPDFAEFAQSPGELRLALHLANDLFHMADWVWQTNSAALPASFTFTDKAGVAAPPHDEGSFATALAQKSDDFARMRGVANAGKHLALRKKPTLVQNEPSHAANTQSKSTGFGEGAFGEGMFGGGPRVILEGTTDLDFLTVATAVRDMWLQLNAKHQWWTTY